jgi:NitT/TauT family transport system substrate-binding protein
MIGLPGAGRAIGRRRDRVRLAAYAAVAAMAVAGVSGCGGNGDETGTQAGTPSKPTQVDVGYIPVTSAAPLLLGIQKGFFKQEGLDVRAKPTEAASTIPAVMSGDLDITFSNPPALLLAKSNGLPLKAIAPAAVAQPDTKAYIQLVTQKDSGIDSPADLAGKKVAVDTLFQLPHIALMRGAQTEGADPATWRFTEIPFPAMAQALKSGKVAAAFMGEPFLTQALAKGDKSILGLYTGWPAGAPFSLYVTSERFLAKNDDVAKRFARAMEKANEYTQQHEDEARRIMPTFLKMPQSVAQKIILPVWSPTLNVKGLETWEKVMTERKVLKKDVDVSSVT